MEVKRKRVLKFREKNGKLACVFYECGAGSLFAVKFYRNFYFLFYTVHLR